MPVVICFRGNEHLGVTSWNPYIKSSYSYFALISTLATTSPTPYNGSTTQLTQHFQNLVNIFAKIDKKLNAY